MEIFIKASSIGEKLGYNFIAYSDSSPTNQFSINRDELLSGIVLTMEDDATDLVVVALDVNVSPFSFTINKNNIITLSSLNTPTSEYRPKNESDEIIPFSEEEFPEYKIEEIRESILKDSILIDYLNKSYDYRIEVSSDQDEEDLSSIKIGVNKSNNSIYFIYRKFQDNTEILEIYDEIGFYQVSRENINSPFILKEWAASDYISGEPIANE
jgi:hypothetical protein